MIITIFILMRWNYRAKLKILVKVHFWNFRQNYSNDLIDKGDVFPFYISRMQFLDSNILSKIFYVSIDSVILRIARTTAHLANMVKRVNLLLIRMKKPNSKCTRIILLMKKIFRKHFKVFSKLVDTVLNVLSFLLNLKMIIAIFILMKWNS